MTKKRIGILLVLAMLISVVAGCGGSSDPTPPAPETPAPGVETPATPEPSTEPSGLLKVGITEASGNFNPLYYSSAYDGYVVDLVFQALATRDFDGEYAPEVAESWDFSEDGKSITFKLRENVVFSDGTPLTANDVVFTYKALSDPSYDGRYGSTVRDLLGYEAYASGETEEFEGVVANGDFEVTFNFTEPLRTNFANTLFAIMPEHHYGANFTYGDTSSLQDFNSDPMGSGPYLLSNYTPAQFVYLERNMNFVGEGYMVKEILLQFVDMSTDITSLLNGDVDLLYGMIEPNKIGQARDAGFSLNEYARSGYGYIKFNTAFGPTAEIPVRQALYYSFPIREFVDNYFKDDATGIVLANVQWHPFSQVSWAIDDAFLAGITTYEHDVAKAAEILDEAGWTLNANGKREKDGQVLELKIAAMPDHDILETLIPLWNRDWGDGLGIELNVAYMEFNTILDYVIYNSDEHEEDWSLFFLATSISTPDPHVQYTSFHSDYVGSGMDNTSRYSNPEIDRLFDEAKSIMDIEEAKPMYQEIARILNEEAVMVPVYANTYFDLYNSKLQNFQTSSLYNWVAAMKDAVIVE